MTTTFKSFVEDMPEYYQYPEGESHKELTNLKQAFFEVFVQYNPKLLEEYSNKPNKNKGAVAFYAIDLPKQLKKLPDKSTLLTCNQRGCLQLSTEINPNGVGDSREPEIARTYVINVAYTGKMRPYKKKHSYDGKYAKLYVYGRTPAEAIEKFKREWDVRIAPVFGLEPMVQPKVYTYPVSATWTDKGKSMRYVSQLYRIGVYMAMYTGEQQILYQVSMDPKDMNDFAEHLSELAKKNEITDLSFGREISVSDKSGYWTEAVSI